MLSLKRIGTRNIKPFIVGLLSGAFVATAIAAVVPYWPVAQVKPVVLVEWDQQFFKFSPIGTNTLLVNWSKSEVVPVALLGYESEFGRFVPLKGGSGLGLTPSWTQREVVPWVEVVLDSQGVFVPRH